MSLCGGQVGESHDIVVVVVGRAIFSNVPQALAEPDTNLRIFNKPEVHGHRRMAVALAIGDSADDARAKAGRVADALTVTVR